MVASGHIHIPGLDFHVEYSPMINDVILRLLMFHLLRHGLKYKVLNIEAVVLSYDELVEEFHMGSP